MTEAKEKLKVLVGTKETQGQRKNDFCFVPEGELVIPPMECDRDRENIDGTCGCRRSMAGIAVRTCTTTFKVAEVAMTEDDYLWRLIESENKSGWLGHPSEGQRFVNCVLSTITLGKELLRTAATWPVGTVLEKRGDRILARRSVQ